MREIIEITDVHAPELEIYGSLNENQLSHYFEPDKNGIFIAETENVIERALNAGYEPMSFLVEKRKYERLYSEKDNNSSETVSVGDSQSAQEQEEEIRLQNDAKKVIDSCEDTTIYLVPDEILREITSTKVTRGILCAMRRHELPKDSFLICDKERIVVMEDVTNPTNVGAIFRSAAALGMDAVLLTGACSDPLYRRSARVSMGTVFQIPWTRTSDNYMDMLHGEGFKTVAMALRDNSLDITDQRLKAEPKLAILMGSESTGLKAETIEKSDYFVKIPMSHGVDSLNVAAASAVACWELGKRQS